MWPKQIGGTAIRTEVSRTGARNALIRWLGSVLPLIGCQ
jgi:hypothetical protein